MIPIRRFYRRRRPAFSRASVPPARFNPVLTTIGPKSRRRPRFAGPSSRWRAKDKTSDPQDERSLVALEGIRPVGPLQPDADANRWKETLMFPRSSIAVKVSALALAPRAGSAAAGRFARGARAAGADRAGQQPAAAALRQPQIRPREFARRAEQGAPDAVGL